jgi:hypothetical protein
MQLARSPYKDVSDAEYRLKLKQVLKEKKKVWTCTSKYAISSSTLYMKRDKEARWGAACHAYMSRSRVTAEDPLIACTEYWHNPNGKYNDFYSWVADKEISPWKKCLGGTKLIINDGAITGLLLFDTRVDRQTFLNLQICARLCSEWERHDVWSTLANAGVHPSVAFYMSHIINKMYNGGLYASQLNWGGHTGLPDEHMSLKRFITGDPKIDAAGEMHKKPCEYYCNRIWTDGPSMGRNAKYVAAIKDAVANVPLVGNSNPNPSNRFKRFEAKEDVPASDLDVKLAKLKHISDLILTDVGVL